MRIFSPIKRPPAGKVFFTINKIKEDELENYYIVLGPFTPALFRIFEQLKSAQSPHISTLRHMLFQAIMQYPKDHCAILKEWMPTQMLLYDAPLTIIDPTTMKEHKLLPFSRSLRKIGKEAVISIDTFPATTLAYTPCPFTSLSTFEQEELLQKFFRDYATIPLKLKQQRAKTWKDGAFLYPLPNGKHLFLYPNSKAIFLYKKQAFVGEEALVKGLLNASSDANKRTWQTSCGLLGAMLFSMLITPSYESHYLVRLIISALSVLFCVSAILGVKELITRLFPDHRPRCFQLLAILQGKKDTLYHYDVYPSPLATITLFLIEHLLIISLVFIPLVAIFITPHLL